MQFDVHATPGRARDVFPYIVEVQSDLASEFKTRYVVSLLPVAAGVGNLARYREEMVAAIDFMIVGF